MRKAWRPVCTAGSAAGLAHDYTTYPIVKNPARYRTIWALFYMKANELYAALM